jgi:hypothetical protein
MIHSELVKSLTDDEASILYYIVHKGISPLGYEPKFEFIKMLRLNYVVNYLDILKKDALEEHSNKFDDLKKKITEFYK